jgi:hypothetical protein
VGVTIGDDTEIVRVIARPESTRAFDEASVVVVGALLTICTSGVAVLPRKLASPL